MMSSMSLPEILVAALLVQAQPAAIEGIVLRAGTTQPIATSTTACGAIPNLSAAMKRQAGRSILSNPAMRTWN